MSEKQISNDRQRLIDKNQEIERRQNFTDKEASDYLRNISGHVVEIA
jgi:hypothetical protein